MKAYTIHKLYTCQLTGAVLAEISFATKEAVTACLHPFTNMANAEAYLTKEARDWFLPNLEGYVNHKRHIIQAQAQTPQAVIESLRVCTEAIAKYETMPLQKICAGFLRGYAHFSNILPNPNNGSHQQSVEALAQLRAFCESVSTSKLWATPNQ